MANPFEKNDPRINRRGRPKKGTALTDILNWALDQKRKITDAATGEEKLVLLRYALAQKLIDKALGGDVAAIRLCYDRVDGKPTESIVIGGAVDSKLKEIMNGGT